MKPIALQLPVSGKKIADLKAGDSVLLSGTIVTGRDMAHRWLVEEKPDEVRTFLRGGAIYHCGPIMKKEGDTWTCISAGPTTSIREEPYSADVIKEYGVRCIIGKGGMGERTARSLKEFGGVYLFAVGGAASVYASRVRSVGEVFGLERFGVPEAMWVMKVIDLPLIVAMDSHGNSLYDAVLKKSMERSKSIITSILKKP